MHVEFTSCLYRQSVGLSTSSYSFSSSCRLWWLSMPSC